jgi:hypothetical protein
MHALHVLECAVTVGKLGAALDQERRTILDELRSWRP